MTIAFQFLLYFFVFVSSVMAVGVPVVYATVDDSAQVRRFVGVSSTTWFVLLILVTVTTFFVV
ncbi:Photosystem II reaction center protein Z [Acaryochloris thomasi RCC1774]|uniref:Photosystem II reaction center protein Z n=1 Tax=Acaryochloris thomasi RCC1774 TaxID=1764569 RepID=A0A2W1JMP9_9CYAN|nr:photosystem II reaction center protein PsbZ [Acaryochloris thomasi]PZD72162.1 Photosystem II reaction center protein Z [Acaryochloris thomasi RCC1774]